MQMIGPYEIRGELGRGAMAVVWRGFDSGIGREVALKEPKIDDSIDPATREELVARFIREGRTAGKLNHPGIVTIYNAEVIDGRPIIAMELIQGETLSSLLRRGRLPVGAAVGIAEQLLDALAYAHARGVVHRDIKPDNVFVTDEGRIKLTDFGIAHAGGGTALTQAGTVMGTPGYMAPEQVRGEPVDARADLFSVGVMLYEMLTGENPFMADGAHPTTIMYRVLNEPLPDVRGAMPEAPPGLAATIAVATATDISQRFGSAEDMRRALLGEVAVAMPKAAKAGGGKSKGLLVVGAVVVGVVVIGALAASSLPNRVTDRTPPNVAGSAEGTDVPVQAVAAPTAAELASAIESLDGAREAAATQLWSHGSADVDIDSEQASTATIPGDILDSCGEVAQRCQSSDDPVLASAGAYLIKQVVSLRAFNDALTYPYEQFPSEQIALARFYGFASTAHLTGDQVSIDNVTSLEAVARQLPQGLGLWLSLTASGGSVLVNVDEYGYSATWESGGGGSTDGGLMSGEYVDFGPEAAGSPTPLVAAGMRVFKLGGRQSWLSWIDQRVLDVADSEEVGAYNFYPGDEELFAKSIALVPGE